MSQSVHEEDHGLLMGSPEGDDAGDFLRRAPLIDQGSQADVGGPQPAVAAPRARTFAEHLQGSEAGAGQSRLQAMRRAHGWKALRPRWWNQKSRDYQAAYRAERLRFHGFDRLARGRERVMDASAGEGRAAGLDGVGPAAANRSLVDAYASAKGQLKSAAGWRRLLPFSSTRRKYKEAREDLRRGQVLADPTRLRGLDHFVRRMPFFREAMDLRSKAKEPRGQGDVAEIRDLLAGPSSSAPVMEESEDKESEAGENKESEGGDEMPMSYVPDQPSILDSEGDQAQAYLPEEDEEAQEPPGPSNAFRDFLKGLPLQDR